LNVELVQAVLLYIGMLITLFCWHYPF